MLYRVTLSMGEQMVLFTEVENVSFEAKQLRNIKGATGREPGLLNSQDPATLLCSSPVGLGRSLSSSPSQ